MASVRDLGLRDIVRARRAVHPDHGYDREREADSPDWVLVDHVRSHHRSNHPLARPAPRASGRSPHPDRISPPAQPCLASLSMRAFGIVPQGGTETAGESSSAAPKVASHRGGERLFDMIGFVDERPVGVEPSGSGRAPTVPTLWLESDHSTWLAKRRRCATSRNALSGLASPFAAPSWNLFKLQKRGGALLLYANLRIRRM